MRRRTASNNGFTLIEIMISVFVFSMPMLVFAGTVPMAERASSMNGEYAQAISLCQHKIDQLRAVGFGRFTYTELSNAQIIDTDVTSVPFQFDVVDDVAIYLPSPTATINIEYPTAKYAKITVTITWKTQSYQSKTSSMTLTAYVTNSG